MTAEQMISERIEDVLRDHAGFGIPRVESNNAYECDCRHPIGMYGDYTRASLIAEHRAHVAAALLAAGILQEVRAEALREAADAADGTVSGLATDINGVAFGGFASSAWLRDRADSIVQRRRDGGAQ